MDALVPAQDQHSRGLSAAFSGKDIHSPGLSESPGLYNFDNPANAIMQNCNSL